MRAFRPILTEHELRLLVTLTGTAMQGGSVLFDLMDRRAAEAMHRRFMSMLEQKRSGAPYHLTANETGRGPFHVAKVPDNNAPTGVNYRVTDAADNRVGTCYTEENADYITAALNSYEGHVK